MNKEENKTLIILGEVKDRLGRVEGKLTEGFSDIKERLTKVESGVESTIRILPSMEKELKNHLAHHKIKSERKSERSFQILAIIFNGAIVLMVGYMIWLLTIAK